MQQILKHSQKLFSKLLLQLGIDHAGGQIISAIPLIERIKVSLTAFAALFIVVLVSQSVQSQEAKMILIGSMGASSVILFALPSSPLAKPWPFLVGHIMSAGIGLALSLVFTELALLAALTIACVLMMMYILECMHPPAAATALVPVLASQHAPVGFEIMVPILINIVVFFCRKPVVVALDIEKTLAKTDVKLRSCSPA